MKKLEGIYTISNGITIINPSYYIQSVILNLEIENIIVEVIFRDDSIMLQYQENFIGFTYSQEININNVINWVDVKIEEYKV